MTWEELYPIVKEQVYYAVLRYDPRRIDKMQELICQSYELYKSHVEKGIPINKNVFKQFITKRSREIDIRSVCKKGYGGTSSLDPLSFVNRRSTSPLTVLEFSDWITFRPKSKENVEATVCFQIDYRDWFEQLNEFQKQILDYLIQGFKASKIAEMVHAKTSEVRKLIQELRSLFVNYFDVNIQLV